MTVCEGSSQKLQCAYTMEILQRTQLEKKIFFSLQDGVWRRANNVVHPSFQHQCLYELYFVFNKYMLEFILLTESITDLSKLSSIFLTHVVRDHFFHNLQKLHPN